jgi:hypothetical protein
VGKLSALTFALPIKKRVFSKEKRERKKEKNLDDIIKAFTFALPIKKGVRKYSQKFFES